MSFRQKSTLDWKFFLCFFFAENEKRRRRLCRKNISDYKSLLILSFPRHHDDVVEA